jgi:hypothetical protein
VACGLWSVDSLVADGSEESGEESVVFVPTGYRLGRSIGSSEHRILASLAVLLSASVTRAAKLRLESKAWMLDGSAINASAGEPSPWLVRMGRRGPHGCTRAQQISTTTKSYYRRSGPASTVAVRRMWRAATTGNCLHSV